MSVIEKLDDYCFVSAGTFFSELCTAVERGIGRKPTVGEFCELLTWGLRACGDDLLGDVNPRNVVALQPKLAGRRKITLQPGDVLAIPSPAGDYYLAVFITANSVGHAFGVFRGKHKCRPLKPGWRPEVFPYPIYADHEYAANGRWRKVGNYPNLLALFPSEPETYHLKRYWPDDDRIGPFGSAESPAGELRHVPEEEARAVGLLTNEWLYWTCPEQVEEFLERRFAKPEVDDRGGSGKKRKRR